MMIMCDCKISIKEQAELRHVLAHIVYAIKALAEGNDNEAIYEVDQVEGLIFWEDDESMTKHLEAINYGKSKEVQQTEKKLQI